MPYSHFVQLTVVHTPPASDDPEDAVSEAAEIGHALGRLIQALHVGAGQLGWLTTRAGEGAQAPVIQNRYALAFPDYAPRSPSSQGSLGDRCQVFGTEEDLRALFARVEVQAVLLANLVIWPGQRIFAVADESVSRYQRFGRVQPMTPAKLRRGVRRGMYAPDALDGLETKLLTTNHGYPYCKVLSLSTRQPVSLFVARSEEPAPVEGWANTYGLSVGGRAGGLPGYPGVVLPCLE